MAEWIERWRYTIAKTNRPGIWRLREGGFLIEGRVTDPRSGKRKWASRLLRDVETIEAAQRERDEMIGAARDEVRGRRARTTSFGKYALSLYERKVTMGDLGSAKSRERWDNALTHHLVPAFGPMLVHEIRRVDVETWKRDQAAKVAAGTYSPSTVNGWLAILLTVLRSAVADFELERDPTRGVMPLPTDDHPTYTEEDPNALTAEQVRVFLETMRDTYPQHYAMTLLGFVTGLRPSSLRPLRSRGAKSDVLWKDDVLLVRRSNALGDEIRETTKTKRHYKIHLPPEVIGVLAGHVASLASPPLSLRWGKPPLWWREPMATSELLFPARDGGTRTRSVLDKPFADVSKRIGLPFVLTPRGMRRTFQDLARAAEVHDVVTRSISGHATEAMQRHYSTAQAEEQRRAIGSVLRLVKTTPPVAGKKAVKGAAAR